MENINETKTENKIMLDGVFGEGYGLIPRLVMQDRKLDIGSKLLYAYLCSFTGAERSCYPSREKICFDLDIGSDTLTRYISKLKESGYIRIEKLREKGRFGHNVYILVNEPSPEEPTEEEPTAENPLMDEPTAEEPSSEEPTAENPTTDEPTMAEPLTDEPMTEDTTAINNNIINTNSINNNFNSNISISKRSAHAREAYGKYKNVFLTANEYAELTEEFPYTYGSWIEQLSAYIASSGKKYSSHLATIRNWAKRERENTGHDGVRGGYWNDVSDEEFNAKWDFYVKSFYESISDDE